ncbi:unknown [Anaerostipes sp. CAG:276]|nr:unknown [Anaerostipes sp. CAG:276]
MYQMKILHTEAVSHAVNGKDSIDKGSAGPDGDQGIHIWRALKQCFKSHLIKLPVNIHDRENQEHLGQPVRNRVVGSAQKRRERKIHHMPHGNVHKRYHKQDGYPESSFHASNLIIYADIPFSACFFLLIMDKGTVASADDSADNLIIVYF